MALAVALPGRLAVEVGLLGAVVLLGGLADRPAVVAVLATDGVGLGDLGDGLAVRVRRGVDRSFLFRCRLFDRGLADGRLGRGLVRGFLGLVGARVG